MIELKDLVGKHILSGVETGTMNYELWTGHEELCGFVKFTLDGIHYLAIEDPEDGYRSRMADLQMVDTPCKVPLPDIEVLCRMEECDGSWGCDILIFTDAMNGKDILKIGTDNCYDYYPYCVFEYTPENMSCNERR